MGITISFFRNLKSIVFGKHRLAKSQQKKDLMTEFPPVFSPALYRSIHADLHGLDDADLLIHYQNFGKTEGRETSKVRDRHDFLQLFETRRPALEIGSFDRCLLRQHDVRHFDVMDQAGLRARATVLNRDPAGVPFIDYISPIGDLSVITDQFDLIISSHAIEHTPDLVTHLQDVARLLAPGGVYALIIPDCRYCFDHHLPASSVADVMQAYFERRKVHTLASVIEHRALTTHNDAVQHWRGLHGSGLPDVPRVKAAIEEWQAAKGSYIDVHAWQFTPVSFESLITSLFKMDYSPLRPLRVYSPKFGEIEFMAVLQK